MTDEPSCLNQLNSFRHPTASVGPVTHQNVSCSNELCKRFSSNLDMQIRQPPATQGWVIYCPVCRQQCYTSDIIENYFMRDGVELDSASNNKASQVCTSCEDNAMASSFCVECVEWLCDACVEAHQRVKFTKDHTMSAKNPGLLGDGKTACERPVFCSIHKQEPLKLFCETCDTLTCRDCQLLTHKDHRYQFLEEAIQNHKMTLENLVTRLTEKKSQLQATTKQVRTRLRDVQEMQKKVQVEIKMAILQIMKELNKRGKTLIQRVEKLAEEQQMKLEQQHLSMSKLHRQMDHALRFASWAINSDNTTALLLCKKLIFYQLHRGIQSRVTTEELRNDIITFLWDSAFWTKNAANFGNVLIEVPPTLSTHGSIPHLSMSGHCPQPQLSQQAHGRGAVPQGNVWRGHVPLQSSHRVAPPTYQQNLGQQLAPPRHPHPPPPPRSSSSSSCPYASHTRQQQHHHQQQQQQQPQQLMDQWLIMPQMNGVQVHQPQGQIMGTAKQQMQMSGHQSSTSLYQQPQVNSKLPSPTARHHTAIGPSTSGSGQSHPVSVMHSSTPLQHGPGNNAPHRPSPPVQQTPLRPSIASSRQLLTNTSQRVHPSIPAPQNTPASGTCRQSPTTGRRIGNSPVDQLKMLVQHATSYPCVILPRREGPANASDLLLRQYSCPGPSLGPEQVSRDESLLYSLVLTPDGALQWSEPGSEGFIEGQPEYNHPRVFAEPRRDMPFKLSDAFSCTEQGEPRNVLKDLQDTAEPGHVSLPQISTECEADSSSPSVKPKQPMKVPYVRLERLQIDLSSDTQLPTFKLLPGNGQDEFSLIVIEGDGLPLNPVFTAPTLESTLTPPNSASPASVTEIEFMFHERTEVPGKRSHHALSPTPSPSEKSPGSIPDVKSFPPCTASEKSEEPDEAGCCAVCRRSGDLACCNRCLKLFHADCHVPAMPSLPGAEWTCSMCKDAEETEVQECSDSAGSSSSTEVDSLSSPDQKRCERLLLLLLCHKLSQALHSPVDVSQLQHPHVDVSSIREKLQRTSSVRYRSPEEFVLEMRLMFRIFGKLVQDDQVTQSVLALESYFEERQSDAFSGTTRPSIATCEQETETAAGPPLDDSPTQPKKRRLDEEHKAPGEG
ncbi:transcription intermediary factor 1-beta [Callorhinchus milii]|nr:transcription intermediary factor 1-beta [Callorhinchus milii]